MKSKISSQTTKINHLQKWGMTFSGVRSRILVWYFLLTTCITLSSVWATYKISCAATEAQAGDRLQGDVSSFQSLVNKQNWSPNQPSDDLVKLLDKFVSPTTDQNKFLFLWLDGQLRYPSQTKPPAFLQNNPQLIQRWVQPKAPYKPVVREGYIIRVVKPIQINGQTRGFMVAIYDATMRYEMSETTLFIVVQVTLFGLVLFSAIAWITAGKALAPLRLLTETARNITETDLTQRIQVQGTDEIAELSLTFNQMLDRLQAAFISQRDFLKDASHELRTPITIIRGHLELLGDDPEERQATVALVKDELKRMSSFINDLLLLAKAERPNFLRWETVELETFTEELFAKAWGLAERNWELEAKVSEMIVIDRQRITQIVMNLAQNATQYTQLGDTIAIGSSVHDDNVRFWVRDTGEGIAIEDQERIFERFARGKNSERRSDGSGLGLSIVQALVKAHGGYIELFSRLGEGSTFTVVIPKKPLRDDKMRGLEEKGTREKSKFLVRSKHFSA